VVCFLLPLSSPLKGLEMYGLGNWAEVAEHVGTKNKEQCITHYRSVYLNSPFFPLPVWTVMQQNQFLLLLSVGLWFD